MAERLPFLRVNKTDIVDEMGRPIHLKGVALGGWLMMEGYMMCGRNIAEKAFKDALEKAVGREASEDFTRSFRETFIREKDIRLIKEWGATCIRIPFNYRLIEFEDRPFSFNEEGISYLDRAIEWCRKYGIYCILDMHAVPGAQNPDWHSDCVGQPEFFSDTFNQERYFRLWRFLAERYKDESTIAGFDVLNEPVVKLHQEGQVKAIYERVTKEIRDADKNHIIFLEGTNWGVRLSFLGTPEDKNTSYSIHTYPPPDYVFNWLVGLSYPCKAYQITWNRWTLDKMFGQYKSFLNKHNVPLYVGEFGINWRDGHYGEAAWTKDMVYLFEKYRFHWTYWTYKTVANSTFPDGVWRYIDNPSWINRKGPVTGWENFYTMWPKEKKKIIASWKTESFKRNDKIYNILQSHF